MRALLSVAIALTAAGAAHAEPTKTLVIQGSRALADNQRIVSTAGLSGSSADRAVLRQRVAFAIAELCDPRRFSVAEPHDAMKCSAEAWADASPKIDAVSPRLAAR